MISCRSETYDFTVSVDGREPDFQVCYDLQDVNHFASLAIPRFWGKMPKSKNILYDNNFNEVFKNIFLNILKL